MEWPVSICSENAIDFLAKLVSVCKSIDCDADSNVWDDRMNCNYWVSVGEKHNSSKHVSNFVELALSLQYP